MAAFLFLSLQFDSKIGWILNPVHTTAQYNYVMTAKVRLLLFWVQADDVGGGYIRRATAEDDPSVRVIQVLFGSDPAKAPRKINHWGAASEAIGEKSSAFFGFMKSAKAGSVNDAQTEMEKQKAQGRHGFEAIISTVDGERAISRVVPLFSDTDFNIHQFDAARRLVADRLGVAETTRQLELSDAACGSGFLQAVDRLVTNPVTKSSVCYVYNARLYTLTLDGQSRVAKKHVQVKRKQGAPIDRTYEDLLHTQFTVLRQDTREKTTFELLLGTKGELRGVPVQIIHQPNWWFQVVLNLE